MVKQVELKRRSEIDTMVENGEATREPPRQIIRDNASGVILSNERVPGVTLPPYLLQWSSTWISYNDIDIETFNKSVREQADRIVKVIQGERFNHAGLTYQQFIDQYQFCMAEPDLGTLRHVQLVGVSLYAVLEAQGDELTKNLQPQNTLDEMEEARFFAVTEAHINLFFYMLILSLARSNQIDSVEGLLRIKLKALETRLQHLLRQYIYAPQNGRQLRDGDKVPASQTLYGWLLLEDHDLDNALALFQLDTVLPPDMSFSALFKEVMTPISNRYNQDKWLGEVRQREFRALGPANVRCRIALQLGFYLEQIKRIHQYIEELTSGSEEEEPVTAVADVRSLLFPRSAG